MFRKIAAVVSLGLTLPVGVASAASFNDPTWPCIQRKVSHLSIGQMWTGEILEPQQIAAADAPTEVLAAALAVRRTSLEEAEALIDTFAKASGEDRAARLTLLFALVFERIDAERSQLVGGIGRYAGKQAGLAERIDTQNGKLAALDSKEDKSNDEHDRLEELADRIEWDTRIFEERQQSLTYVCETPVLLEKRAFALARMMMERME